MSETNSINFAFGFVFGLSVKIPSMSLKRINKSADQIIAISALKLSLSPIENSSVLTESFSFIIGITP